jgi:L-threonylcarbamoyladenylate synthase
VAIRMPNNKIALELIDKSGVPIAAPSANSSGRPSPTKASHVLDDLNGRIDAIIDGGSCKRGIESTVIDVRQKTPVILRLGSITLEQIEKEIGKVRLARPTDKVRSPGMKYRHYAPKAELILVEGSLKKADKRAQELVMVLRKQGRRVEIISGADTVPRRLYSRLRKGDADVLIAKAVEEVGMGRAVMDRLRRAASRIEKV